MSLREKKRRKPNKRMLAVATFLLFLGLSMIGINLWHTISQSNQAPGTVKTSTISTHHGPHHG